MTSTQRAYQRAHYDVHYPRHAAAVREQRAHPGFATFGERMAGYVLDRAQEALPSAGRDRPLRVYEAGAGEGLLHAALQRVAGRRGLRLESTLSDLSPAGLALAAEAVEGRLITGDALEVTRGLEPASVDLVVLKNLLHHVDEPALLLDACRDALASGGRIAVIEARVAHPVLCGVVVLFAWQRERLWLRGRRRNLDRPVAAGGFVVERRTRWSAFPWELFLAIRVDWFRRLWSTRDQRRIDRAYERDDRLTRLAPFLAAYDIWTLSAGPRGGRP